MSDEKKTEDIVMLSELELREELNGIKFDYVDIPELYETMQVPSYSKYEFRMATYIIMWARRNSIDYKIDKKGNVYLTKGVLEDGEYYPCLTSHMDTVQDDAESYALAGAELPIKTRKVKNQHELYIDGQGIGADDKLGVYISLQLMKKFDKIKAAFFVEEEIGMNGSDQMDKSFFDDVAYVIGWDSPDLHRAAWKCSGTALFSYDFYINKLSPIVKRWGFVDKDFNSEPYTDVMNIKKETELMCMNFGNGGYKAHSSTEYLVVEDVDHAIGMGQDIIESLGNKEVFKDTFTTYAERSKSEEKLSKMFGCYYYDYGYNYYNKYSNSGYTSGNTSSQAKVVPLNQPKEDDSTLQYIIEMYEKYIDNLKNNIVSKCNVITDELKDKFREAGVDFDTFGIDIKENILESFNKDITF